MSELEIAESQQLSRILAEIESKLMFWKHQRDISGWIVEKLSEKQGKLVMRQKELIEEKAKAAR